mgnify:FL=1
MKQHYFSLSFYPTTDESISLLKQIVEPSVFEAGDKNKVRETTINKRYDCLIRILSSVITLTQLDLNTGIRRQLTCPVVLPQIRITLQWSCIPHHHINLI